jgi:PAS domain S-box-containing protein
MARELRSSPIPERLALFRTGLSSTSARAVTLLLVGASYYVAASLGLRLALVEHNVTPLWPPTGIAVVAFLLLGSGTWPAVAIAALLVNLPISASPLAAAITAAGNTLAPLVAATLLDQVRFRRQIDRLRDALAIVFLAALGSMAISASVGTATLVLAGTVPQMRVPGTWAVWWTGDAMGVLVVAPFLLSLVLPRRAGPIRWARVVEATLLFASLTALSLLVASSDLNLLFVALPLLGWAAWRFQLRGSAPAALIVSGIATWSAAHGTGPFAEGSLLHRMLSLQAFNASVAFTSFFFSAAISERMRARQALEDAAAELETRVLQRTADLSEANARLEEEISERRQVEARLRQQERVLAEAQRIAHTGSWEWLIGEDRVEWSDEMYRIYGYDARFGPLTFGRAVERIVPEDLGRIRASLAVHLEESADRDLPTVEYRIALPDGTERYLRGKARLIVDEDGKPARLVGWVQDITEDKQAEREHRIAETLQRSLLLERLPQIPGIALAARYVPASADMVVGGDWYDVIELPNGFVGLAIGDVAGHGLPAASTMGQLRTAVRVYAFEESSPAAVLTSVHGIARRWLVSEMATLLYAVFDPDSGDLTFASAGHPPPLVIDAAGEGTFLGGGLAPPLGAAPAHQMYVEKTTTLGRDATLLLYTDGLVERRGLPIESGLARLKETGEQGGDDLDAMLDRLLATLVGTEVSDDVALLALRPVSLAIEGLRLRVPAEPRLLAPLRHTLRRWLRQVHASPQEVQDIVVACQEACTNAIQHAHGASGTAFEVHLELVEGVVEVIVRDAGRWRRAIASEGGRGILLMEGLMDSVEVRPSREGTMVRMRRELAGRQAP